MDTDSIFTTGGTFATTKDFWDTYKGAFVSASGITPAFSKLLGECVLEPIKAKSTPFLNDFMGRPTSYGSVWAERMLAKKSSVKFNPKASSNDAFGYYESEGIESVYTMSVAGRISISLPSELETAEMMNSGAGVASLANAIREQQSNAYRMDLNSEIGKKLISTTKAEVSVDTTDFNAVRKLIRGISATMHTDNGTYTDMTDDEKTKYRSATDNVICYIPETLAGDMTSNEAGLPSPEKLVNNCTVRVIADDAMPTPITTAEYSAGETAQGWTAKPVAIDKSKPAIFMCSARRAEYRPYINSYRVKYNGNGAGDFDNYHLIYKGSMGVRKWENAIRINTA